LNNQHLLLFAANRRNAYTPDGAGVPHASIDLRLVASVYHLKDVVVLEFDRDRAAGPKRAWLKAASEREALVWMQRLRARSAAYQLEAERAASGLPSAPPMPQAPRGRAPGEASDERGSLMSAASVPADHPFFRPPEAPQRGWRARARQAKEALVAARDVARREARRASVPLLTRHFTSDPELLPPAALGADLAEPTMGALEGWLKRRSRLGFWKRSWHRVVNGHLNFYRRPPPGAGPGEARSGETRSGETWPVEAPAAGALAAGALAAGALAAGALAVPEGSYDLRFCDAVTLVQGGSGARPKKWRIMMQFHDAVIVEVRADDQRAASRWVRGLEERLMVLRRAPDAFDRDGPFSGGGDGLAGRRGAAREPDRGEPAPAPPEPPASVGELMVRRARGESLNASELRLLEACERSTPPHAWAQWSRAAERTASAEAPAISHELDGGAGPLRGRGPYDQGPCYEQGPYDDHDHGEDSAPAYHPDHRHRRRPVTDAWGPPPKPDPQLVASLHHGGKRDEHNLFQLHRQQQDFDVLRARYEAARAEREAQIRAETRMASAYRGHKERSRMRRRSEAAAKIQAIERGRLARGKYSPTLRRRRAKRRAIQAKSRYEHAAVVIERLVRSSMGRQRMYV
jgi:hypothetical protein